MVLPYGIAAYCDICLGKQNYKSKKKILSLHKGLIWIMEISYVVWVIFVFIKKWGFEGTDNFILQEWSILLISLLSATSCETPQTNWKESFKDGALTTKLREPSQTNRKSAKSFMFQESKIDARKRSRRKFCSD